MDVYCTIKIPKVAEVNIKSCMRIFSIITNPCVISMVVAALYNIVDQIFIGWSEVGAYGNAATNIVYPFTVLALGLALLVGWCFFDAGHLGKNIFLSILIV